MVIVWIIIGALFLIGLYLTLFPNKLVSWWLKQHSQITDKIGAFKPVAGYRIYYKLGPIVFRIAGIVLIGGSLYGAYVALCL